MNRSNKIITIVLLLAMALSLSACGGGNAEYYKLGDTVSTDIFEFTLNAAEFTVALNRINDENFYTPKVYDPQRDSGNPYLASVGHTLAAFSYTVTNLDRTSAEFHNGSFVTVTYDGKDYSKVEEGAYFAYQQEQYYNTNGKLQTQNIGWYKNPANNLLLSAGETETRRASIDVHADIKDLTEDVKITFSIPNSEGKKIKFTYLITEEDRANYTKSEIKTTLNLALVYFPEQFAQEYFLNHMDEYPIVTGEELNTFTSTTLWRNIAYIAPDGTAYSNSLSFWFDNDGTIHDNRDGKYNGKTWTLDGDILVIDGIYRCEVRSIPNCGYLLFNEGKPFILLH